jgi:hypothetical protein
MGCASIRGRISLEEEAITLMESQLEYFKNSCIEVDQVIRKYSSSSKVNLQQFSQIIEFLEIKTVSDPVCPLVEDFYKELRDENNEFDLNVLLINGILLSNGMSRQKARLLFEVFDIHHSDHLSKVEISSLIDIIKDLVVDRLPKLVHNSTNPPVSRKHVMKYSEKITEKFKDSKEKLMNLIFGNHEEVSLKDFVVLFDNEKNGRILTPFGFRNYVLDLLEDDEN